ncbi:MAG TPA: pro-sigmaK processing inhibitor BofA family protein [Methanoregulaceae archaeon]|nr:pro-sigmaK processing inhibitor BofA family protein [Methanoregulaceae archaeon]
MQFDIVWLIAGILIAFVLFLLLKNIVKLIINSILGLLILFSINYFNLMEYVGLPDINMNLVTILFCALGGIPGALLIVIMHLLGIGGF